jgi:endoglucanase
MKWCRAQWAWVWIGAQMCTLALAGGLIGPAAATPADFIHAQGAHLVDGRGDNFAVRGINLGNWLVPEGYMFKFKHALSPSEIDGLFASLLGAEGAAQFWKKFRDVYIAKEDIDFIKAAGFNTVRVPLDWRLFVEPGAGGESDRFEGPGWALLDRLVQWCHAAGLYAVIDLHAAPGGQTGVNHDDGPGFPLTFYVPRYRQLTIALWQKLAAHYRDETAILGYDLLNEPISPYSDVNYLNPRLEPLYRDIVAAMRSTPTTNSGSTRPATVCRNISTSVSAGTSRWSSARPANTTTAGTINFAGSTKSSASAGFSGRIRIWSPSSPLSRFTSRKVGI